MKKYLVLLLFFIQMSFYAQKKEAVKPNSIIFTETSLGIFNYGDKGASIFLEMALFFQKESNVFSFKAKFLGSAPFSIDIEPTKPTLIKETNEYSVSYGKRFFRNNFSYSFLGGISYSKNREILTNKKMSFIGFPFEINAEFNS